MAFITCHYFSHALGSNITINVCLPTPSSGDKVRYASLAQDFGYDTGLPVLYLLHGMYGDCNSWPRYSSIDRYAQDHRIAVVMASGGNDFYQNMPGGLAYETFFTRELPAYIRALFPVSERREDTFIAGLSMGGYGAWHLALAAPEVFSKAASMSGALDIVALYESAKSNPEPSVFNWKAIFGDPDALAGSHSDLFAQYAQCAERRLSPKLYQTCGTEDFLYALNIGARDRMLALGADLTYTEGPGAHDWSFWDHHIQEIMDWLLEDRKDGKGGASLMD